MSDTTKISYADLHRKPSRRKSISFSIAYVRMCEWAQNPQENPRPKGSELVMAKDHATYIGDEFILEKIKECEEFYKKCDNTPTPKLPKPTKHANRIAEEVTEKIREITKPYSQELLSESDRIDQELDLFIRDMKAFGL